VVTLTLFSWYAKSNFSTIYTLSVEKFVTFLISQQNNFQVGAMSHGKIESDYIDDFISGKLFLDSFLYIILCRNHAQ
jgi:hypothetical protein